MSYYIGTKKECEDLRKADADANGLPRKGKHRGGGKHVELGDMPGPGWTLYKNEVVKHPDLEQYAYPTTDLREEDVKEEDKAKVKDAKTKEVEELPADWAATDVVEGRA